MPGIQCHVWWAPPAQPTPRLLAMLTDDERARHETYRREVDRGRFLAGRTVARAVAGAELGIDPAAVVLDSTCADCGRHHGKPAVVAPPDHPGDRPLPRLSISHSGGRVAVAMIAVTEAEDVRIGVDVEEIRDVQADELAGISLSADEQTNYTAIPDADRRGAFFTYWARKEAVLKATGRGLALPMSKLTLSAATEPPKLVSSELPDIDPTLLWMSDLDAGADYRAAVALLGPSVTSGEHSVQVHDGGPLVAELS